MRSGVPTSAGRAACPCAPSSRLPQAELPRYDSFFSGAVYFVRRTLARSAFHGFSIGFQRCKRASGAPRGSSFACGCSVALRAWFCGSVRASDALRCAPALRVLKLSRIIGFHLYDILHSQQSLSVRVFGKTTQKDVHGLHAIGFTKGYFAVLTRTCRIACFLHLPGAVLRAAGISSFESA